MYTEQQAFNASVKATNDGLFPLFVLYIDDSLIPNVIVPNSDKIICVDDLTAGKFINSNTPYKSLLNSLDNRLLYIPDLAVCMEHKRYYDLFRYLRCSFDGEIRCSFGNRFNYYWKGKFNLFTSMNEAAYHHLCLKEPMFISRFLIIGNDSIRRRELFRKFSKYFSIEEIN